MNQAELVRKLDEHFGVNAYDEREQWQQKIPPADIGVYRRYARPEFFEGPWNGLMLDNALEVDRVYLIVFPGQDVLDTILALELERASPGALISPTTRLTLRKRARFCGISGAMEELREHDTSFYSCHQPLDYHPETSTQAR